MTDNVTLVRSGYEAFARGDLPGFLELLDDNIEWTEAAGFPYAGTYTGPDAVVENVFARLGAEWDDFSAVPDAVIGQEDSCVATGWYSGTYKATGKSFRARFAHVWEFRVGKLVRLEQIVDSVPVVASMS